MSYAAQAIQLQPLAKIVDGEDTLLHLSCLSGATSCEPCFRARERSIDKQRLETRIEDLFKLNSLPITWDRCPHEWANRTFPMRTNAIHKGCVIIGAERQEACNACVLRVHQLWKQLKFFRASLAEQRQAVRSMTRDAKHIIALLNPVLYKELSQEWQIVEVPAANIALINPKYSHLLTTNQIEDFVIHVRCSKKTVPVAFYNALTEPEKLLIPPTLVETSSTWLPCPCAIL